MRRDSQTRSTDTDIPATSSTSRRNVLRDLINRIGLSRTAVSESPKRGRLLLESLEPRQLMAGDIEMLFTDGASASTTASQSSLMSVTTTAQTAEGEAAPDLVQFAKDLTQSGTIFYGAYWCGPCSQQKELFEDGADDLPFVDVTNSDRTPSSLAIDEGVTSYPTWEFPDGSRLEGVQTLATLSARSEVPIPQSENPIFEPIGNQTVQIGAPLHIPVDAFDPDGGPLTVTVSVANPELLEAVVLQGNRSIRIDMNGYGDMVFELFEDRAPVATGRVAELAEANFYDGIIFHRVLDNFVLQAGDPTGTGSGGSTLGDFDDDFHPDLQHTGTGVLSYAKAGDDTNDSQFFITEGSQRHLDFNHSVFGQLVEGDDVREAISEHSVDSQGRPSSEISINTVDLFTDTENSVVMLKAKGNTSDTTNVTFTVADQDGNTFSETITVAVVADNSNSQPFLNPIATPAPEQSGTPATLQLSSTDVEGDAVVYTAVAQGTGATATVNATTGLVTVTPNSGFTGTVPVLVSVSPQPGVVGAITSGTGKQEDFQTVNFTFQDNVVAAPSGLDLLSTSDTGISDTDNITRAATLSFLVSGVTTGATVELVNTANGAVLGVGAATGSTVTISTNNIAALGDGTYNVTARQRIGSDNSSQTTPITVTYDTLGPASVTSTAATQANVGRAFTTDLINNEEGNGLVYALGATQPTGMTINSATGQIIWTPTASQVGDNTVDITLTDAAGNERSESFTIKVSGEPLAEVKLSITDLQGNAITKLQVGQKFLLNMSGVDNRTGDDLRGVFAAFADILFDSTIVRPVPGTSINFSDRFPTVQNGTFSNGLIDELGAATDRLTPSDLEEVLIATIEMEALAAGSVNIRSEPADLSGSEVLLYGVNNQISADTVAYGSVTLAIGQNFTVANDSITVAEDSGVTLVDVLANDTVINGTGTLSIVSVTQPTQGGSVNLEGNEVRFFVDQNFNGDFEFTYRVRDTEGVQETATVTVTVTPVNDPPTGVDDTFNVDQGSINNSFTVLDNDTFTPDTGESLTVSAVGTSTAGATMTIAADNQSIIYTPPASFTGTDTFTYTVSDGSTTDEVTVTVTVAPADPPPTAVSDAFTINEDAVEAAFDVLANDTRDTSNEAFVIDSAQTPSQGGAVRISTDGTQFFYTPKANFNGTETVTYTIRDTGGGLAVGTVTFTVNAVNDAPPVTNTTFDMNRGGGEKIALSLTDLPDNVDSAETLTFSNLGTPTAGGSVRIDSATNTIRYTPSSATFTGTDTFTYQVNDGSSLTSSGTITIEVSDFSERNIYLAFDQLGVKASQINGIVLRGTDALNADVEVPLSFAEDQPSFQNILPGSYTVELPSIPFFANTVEPMQLSVTSLPEDGDSTVDLSIGSLLPEFISIRDWLGSTPRKSLLVAIEPGASSSVLVPSAQTDTIDTPTISLDSDGETLSINGTRTVTDSTTNATSTESINASLPTTNDRRVQSRGQVGQMRLYRVSVESDEVAFQTTTSSTSAQGESPQGESVSQQTAALQSVSFGEVQAEGESLAAQSVSQSDLFVPSTSDNRTRTDATVIALDEGDVWAGESTAEGVPAPQRVFASDDSVDTAMQAVTSELTRVSQSGDAIAESSLEDQSLVEAAIDAVIKASL
ncbi:putative peptidyl-prolyl cis-trans isomerase [Planctomycetes bacterium CA13]|uniref:peptidylprolyl isomerase n=1 Tax=Novipirellula herctigrandis TaxID=2527986 RepID=A0A5C5YVN0_9BACT|nr:putative peptidyl-prolyl cis-trans isomerase [Planctomycetes bacterium CA13]